MFIINILLNKNHPHLSPAQAMEAKRVSLGLTDELIYKKFLFGFFARGTEDTSKLSKYEWFVGSLSGRTLRDQLSKFLKTEEAQALDPETLEQIENYILIAEDSSDLEYQIDLARSSNLPLLLLVATGSKRFKDWSTDSMHSQVDHWVHLTLERLHALKPGETVVFTGGSLIHETQLAVCLFEDGTWEVRRCDGGAYPTLRIYHPLKAVVLSKPFWEGFYKEKFCMDDKVDEGLYALLGYAEGGIRAKAAALSQQTARTCHLSCHLVLLKSYIIDCSELRTDDAVDEWKKFKELFGSFLLRQQIDDRCLADFCRKQLEKLIRSKDKERVFKQCVAKKKYKETRRAYETILGYFGWEPVKRKTSKTKDLVLLHEELLSYLNKACYVQPDLLRSFIDKIGNPYLSYTFNCYDKTYKQKQVLTRRLIDQEIQDKERGFSLGFIISRLGFDEKKVDLHWAPLEKKDLFYYLKLFEQYPELQLHGHVVFTNLLAQGIQEGAIEQVVRILTQLPESQRAVYQNLHTHFFAPTLPLDVKRYIIEHANAPFRECLLKIIAKQAAEDLDVTMLMLLPPSQLKPYINGQHTDLTLEQVERIVEDLSEFQIDNNSEIYTYLVYTCIIACVKNGSTELFGKLARKLEKLQLKEEEEESMYPIRVPHVRGPELVKWGRIAEKSNPTFTLMLREVLLFSFYKEGHFRELPLSPIRVYISNANQYARKWEEDDLKLGLDLLKDEDLDEKIGGRLLQDLVVSALLLKRKDLFLELSHIAMREHMVDVLLSKKHPIVLMTMMKYLLETQDTCWNPIFIASIDFLILINQKEAFDLTAEIGEFLAKNNCDLSFVKAGTGARLFLILHPKSPISYKIRESMVSSLLNTVSSRYKSKTQAYIKARTILIDRWMDWIKAFPVDNPQDLYRKFLKPFQMCRRINAECILDIWEHFPPSQQLRDAFAILFLKRGERELAEWVFPDRKGLEALRDNSVSILY